VNGFKGTARLALDGALASHRSVAVLPFSDFVRAIGASGALIGVDPGAKRIGAAACDPGRLIASPIAQIQRTKLAADADQILALAAGRDAVGIVIGLPLNMDGSNGPAAQSARSFAGNLAKLTVLPITMWDERLTTSAVNRTLIDADASRKRRGEVIDKLAAAYLLQGLIDRLQEDKARSE
jgi:putative holliday junction resolvase